MNKDFIFLILLLIIVFGVLFWQNPETIDFYFDKIKAGISPQLELSQDSGLNLSEVNIESLFKEEEPAFTEVSADEGEEGIGGPLIGEMIEEEPAFAPEIAPAGKQEVVVLEKKLTLEEIEQEVNRVAKEVERIDKEIQILVALDKVQ